jgi:hypothetical protein
MKFTISIIALLLSTYIISCDRTQRPTHDKQLLQTDFKKGLDTIIKLWNKTYSYPTRASDSMDILNTQLADTLKKYKDLVFLLSDLPSPLNKAMSADSNMAIVSWDDWQGGTMRNHVAIVFYKTANKVNYIDLYHPENDSLLDDMLYSYDTIVTVQSNNTKYYLARGFGRTSTKDWMECLRAFKVEKDTLSKPEIFPAKFSGETEDVENKFTNGIYIWIDIKSEMSFKIKERPVIIFDTNNRLKVPIINDDGGPTKGYYTLELVSIKYLKK